RNRRPALNECLIRKAEGEEGHPQERLRNHLWMKFDLMDRRSVGNRIIEPKRLFQMRPGRHKPTIVCQVYTKSVMTQNKASGIVALIAKTQQILDDAQRYVEFPAVRVVGCLPVGNSEKLCGGTQLLPQLLRTSID